MSMVVRTCDFPVDRRRRTPAAFRHLGEMAGTRIAVRAGMVHRGDDGSVGLGCFSPVTFLSIKELYRIRPFIFADEGDIRYFIKQNALPVVRSTCPEDKHTDREKYKQMVEEMDRENKGLKHRIFTAIEKGNIDGFRVK